MELAALVMSRVLSTHSQYQYSIKGPIKDLIEIRKIRSTWRVLTYNAKAQKKLVMLDAFESHKHTSTLKAAQRVKPKAKIVKDILRKSE